MSRRQGEASESLKAIIEDMEFRIVELEREKLATKVFDTTMIGV